MKYTIEAFRNGEVDGVALTGGEVVARVETDLPFSTLQKALATGLAEPVKVKEPPPESSSEPDEEGAELPPS